MLLGSTINTHHKLYYTWYDTQAQNTPSRKKKHHNSPLNARTTLAALTRETPQGGGGAKRTSTVDVAVVPAKLWGTHSPPPPSQPPRQPARLADSRNRVGNGSHFNKRGGNYQHRPKPHQHLDQHASTHKIRASNNLPHHFRHVTSLTRKKDIHTTNW